MYIFKYSGEDQSPCKIKIKNASFKKINKQKLNKNASFVYVETPFTGDFLYMKNKEADFEGSESYCMHAC